MQISIDELNHHLDFDSTRFVLNLCRNGFLVQTEGAGDEIRRYSRQDAAWPPPSKYLHAGPIGFAYYLQTWFRYYLQRYIESKMSEIEAKEGMYSLSFTRERIAEDGESDCVVPDAGGAFVERRGQWWTTNTFSSGSHSDLSRMDLAWVNGTEDP